MKRFIVLSIVMLFALAGYAAAYEDMEHNGSAVKSEKMTSEVPSTAVEVGNTVCPVSGDKIEAGGNMGDPVKYEYNGKIYSLCCAMCIKDFKKDPAKYSKIAEEQAAQVKGN